MSIQAKKQSDIPEAVCYVMATDTFMSGWGEAAGKLNTVVLPCDSKAEAEIVAENARNRTDMDCVRICSGPPRVELRSLHLISVMCREDASRWYEVNGF